MANRALAVPCTSEGGGACIHVTSSGPVLDITYIVLEPDNTVLKTVVQFSVPLTYDNLHGIDDTVRDAVQANESDSSLQVSVF